MLYRKYPVLVGDPIGFLQEKTGYRSPLTLYARDEDFMKSVEARLMSRLEGGEWSPATSSEAEVASLLLSLYIASRASRLALTRFIDGELEYARRMLEGEDLEVLARAAGILGVRLYRDRAARIPWLYSRGRLYYRELALSAPFTDVFENIEGVDVTSLYILDGRVYLDRELLVTLITGVMRRRLYRLAEDLSGAEVEGVEDLVERVRRLVEHGAPLSAPVSEDLFPDCIKSILSKPSRGEPLSDEEVYVVATFLAGINAGSSMLERLLVEAGLVKPELAPLIGGILYEEARGFKPYNCKTLQEMGICRCRGSLISEYWARARRGRG